MVVAALLLLVRTGETALEIWRFASGVNMDTNDQNILIRRNLTTVIIWRLEEGPEVGLARELPGQPGDGAPHRPEGVQRGHHRHLHPCTFPLCPMTMSSASLLSPTLNTTSLALSTMVHHRNLGIYGLQGPLWST